MHTEPTLITPQHLQPVLAELQRLEPLFHAFQPDASPRDFEQLVAPDFWEVGASGHRYSRAFVLQVLAERAEPQPASFVAWRSEGFGIAELGADTYLLTYTLHQPGRVTRRASIWRRTPAARWQVVYHQGTVVAPTA